MRMQSIRNTAHCNHNHPRWRYSTAVGIVRPTYRCAVLTVLFTGIVYRCLDDWEPTCQTADGRTTR